MDFNNPDLSAYLLKSTIFELNELSCTLPVHESLRSKSAICSSCFTDFFEKENNKFTRENLLISLSTNKGTLELQKGIQKISKEKEISKIIENLSGSLTMLINGKFSNYFMSDLIKKCSKSQKLKIIYEIYSKIDQLAINEYGSHPIQTLIEKASSKEEINLIINPLTKKNNFLKVAKNPNGTHVIQKLITLINENYRMKLNNLILSNMLTLSTDAHGVCIVVKFITTCENQKYLSLVVNLFSQYIRYVSDDQYGNYAVQALIKTVSRNEKLNLILSDAIIKNFVNLSTNQFGSHIISNFLATTNDYNKCKVFKYLYNENKIGKINSNLYGHSIICKYLKLIDSSGKKAFYPF